MLQAEDEVPAKFYKYRPMNTPEMIERVEKIVMRNELYFAAPSTFNDPFDLKPVFSLEATLERQREDCLRLSRKYEPHMSEAQSQSVVDKMLAEPLGAENIAVTSAIIQLAHEQILNRVGVFCVSAKHDDILMWSHYADSHKGVCLEFDGLSTLMADAQQVSYSRKRVPVNPYLDGVMAMMEKGMLTKSDHWKYENEWRLCRYKEGPGTVQLKPSSLTGIILGALAKQATVETVCKWASQRACPLPIYQATTSGQEFELLIAPYVHN